MTGVAPLFDYPSVRTIALGSLPLHTWGLFVAAGVLVGSLVAARRMARMGFPKEATWNLAFWLTVAGLFGARLLYVAEYWRDFVAEPWRVFAFWEGGMSAWGAILCGVPTAWWYARSRALHFGALAAAAAPALLLGDAIGRLGGAASHMYPGTPTRFPISYLQGGVQRHEVGIDLALASFAGYLVVMMAEQFRNRTLGPGQWEFSAPVALCWYSLARFLLDFLRASDLPGSDLRYGGLTLAQLFAVGALSFLAVVMVRWRTRPA